MKILYYYSQLNIGGAEKSTVRLLNAFVQKGHDVTLLLRWNGGTLENELDGKVKRIYLKESNDGKINKFSQVIQTIKSYFRMNRLKNKVFQSGFSLQSRP